MPLIIRPSEAADIPFMGELRAQTKGTQPYWADRIDRYLRGEHSPQRALESRSAFVAEMEAKIVGFIAGHRTRRFDCDGEVQWIDVDRAYRACGIGYALVSRIGAWFVAQNSGRICVNVAPDNIAACKLYAKCGACPLNEHWMVWDDSSLICAQVPD